MQFGRVKLDMDARQLLQDDGEVVALTSMEFDLLNAFAQNPNRVLTRDRLLDLAHHRDSQPYDRSIDIRIARLRRKIEPDPGKPQVIKTIHGTGYMYVRPKAMSEGARTSRRLIAGRRSCVCCSTTFRRGSRCSIATGAIGMSTRTMHGSLGGRSSRSLDAPWQELVGEAPYAELRPLGARALAGEVVRWEGWMPHHVSKEPLFVQRFYVPYRTADGSIDGYFDPDPRPDRAEAQLSSVWPIS